MPEIKTGVILCGLTLFFGFVGCDVRRVSPPDVSGELVIATRNSPTTYYIDQSGRPAGFEYDLASRFAEKNGWRLRVVVEDDLGLLFDAVRRGRVNLAAAGVTATDVRKKNMSFGPGYRQVQEIVVCNTSVRMPRNPGELHGLHLEVTAASSHVESLQAARQQYPLLAWVEQKTVSADGLLERVSLGLSDCTVSDSDALAVARNFFPGLQDAFVLRQAQPHAWMMRQAVDVSFLRKMARFFAEMNASGELATLRERYFGHVHHLEEADVRGILARLSWLPRSVFQEAASQTGLDWRLLAAMAYQESHWDADATSATGVRGMMMLTEDTAERLGVSNRLDAQESVLGGARYINLLREALPAQIEEPDRTWFALAAYNIGSKHLEDARILARRLGRNPDKWMELKTVLPLLAQARYHSTLRYGFARGGEARAFTENVRIYYDILCRHEKASRARWGQR